MNCPDCFHELKEESLKNNLCPCEEISVQNFCEQIEKTKPDTMESLLAHSKVMQGKCHGGLCHKSVEKIAS